MTKKLDSANPFLNMAPLSPFAAAVPAMDAVPENAPEGSYTYEMVGTGSSVDASEVETEASAIDIVIKWGDSILHTAHLAPPRAFCVGEEGADFFLPSEKLGASRVAIVDVDASGAVVVGEARAPLAFGAKTKLVFAGNVTIEVASVKAAKKIDKLALKGDALPFPAISILVHAGLLACAAAFMPALGTTDEDGIAEEQRHMMQVALQTTAERETDQRPDESTTDNTKNEAQGGTGARAMHEEGVAGSQLSTNKDGRFAVKGDKNNQDTYLSRTEALQQVHDFGMLGLLNAGLGGDPKAPTAAWGRETSSGNDPFSANGNIWGTTLADAAGSGGLGLSGIGEGGGGLYEGIGLGKIGTIGHGDGIGDGQGFGPGHGSSTGLFSNVHHTTAPRLRIGETTASGHIPPEVIQRVVRQNFGRFKACYENGLRNNPNLQGRVAVRFIIGHDGNVQSAANGGSDMPDAGVVSCVTKAFYSLNFPQPDQGIVTVTYPIAFSPAGS